MGRLEGKVAIVTGAGSGIGRTTALLFASEGAKVILTDINEQSGKDATTEAGSNTLFLSHDVSNEEDWQTVISETLAQFDKLDVLVNNAAISGEFGVAADPENATVENWDKIHRVNALGPFLGCKHGIPAMRESGGGSIVNVSSAGALIPSPMDTPYGMAKAGVTNLTLSVAMHCAVNNYNIRCNTVYPGGTRTPMLERLLEAIAADVGATVDDVASEWGRKNVPLGRLAQPQDIAMAILFLASDESAYITAEQLVVDGGSRYPTFLAES
jgi:3(or 17)beta-hydroxysteroid dehydrogenase